MRRAGLCLLTITTLACVLVLANCRTIGTRNIVLEEGQPLPERPCLPEMEWYNQFQTFPRLSTKQLEEFLHERIENPDRWECQFNYTMLMASYREGLGLPNPQEGETPEQVMEANGGFFGGIVDIGGNKLVVHDNKMQYKWALDPANARFLAPNEYYNNLIPLREGSEQPEIAMFLQDGDIIVYFHPEYRDTSPDHYNQFRASHSATVLEKPGENGRPLITRIDTPGSYARPFNGSEETPFHVFRLVPRDGSGQALPVETAKAYRRNISRWGAISLNRFPFEGDYDKLTFKHPDQIDDYAERYLASQFPEYDSRDMPIIPMYCAWYSYQNLTLGYMRPLNERGLANLKFRGADDREQPFFAKLTEGDNGYVFPRLEGSANLGDNSFKQNFMAPENLAPNNEMVFQPVTAPELLLNFLDRVVGKDHVVPPEMWQAHASLKVGILRGGFEGFLYQFTTHPDPRFPPPSDGTTPEDYERYNQAMQQTFERVIGQYEASIALQGEEQARARKEIKDAIWNIIQGERLKPRVPRKWMPPYAYIRESDNYEVSYNPDNYVPKVVYVGTVVPERFLKNRGQQEEAIILPIGRTRMGDNEWQLQNKITRVLRESGFTFPDNKSPVDQLMLALHSECRNQDPATCKGLNEFELSAIMTMRNHWRTDFEWVGDRIPPEEQVVPHNKWGLDETLIMRTLINVWNDPTTFRDAVYAGPNPTVASAAGNLRIIMSEPPEDMVPKDQRVYPADVPRPRRVTKMKCDPTTDRTVDFTNLKCDDNIGRTGEDLDDPIFFRGGPVPI